MWSTMRAASVQSAPSVFCIQKAEVGHEMLFVVARQHVWPGRQHPGQGWRIRYSCSGKSHISHLKKARAWRGAHHEPARCRGLPSNLEKEKPQPNVKPRLSFRAADHPVAAVPSVNLMRWQDTGVPRAMSKWSTPTRWARSLTRLHPFAGGKRHVPTPRSLR
jgi:hypothetical protein